MKATATLLASLLIASVASAQPAPPPDGGTPAKDPATMTPEEKKAEAKAHYEKGNTHYNLGEFDKAIDEFKAAYALTSATGLLFNIAQAYRLKNDYERASYFYKTYLRLKPEADNRAVIEERIKEMDDMLEKQKAQVKLPPTGTEDPNKDKDKVKPPDPKTDPLTKIDDKKDVVVEPGNGKPLKLAGMATAGGGVLLIITGAVFGSMASSASSDLDALSSDHGTWTPEQQDKYDSGKRNNTIAIASFAIGGAAIAAGGVLYYLGYKKEHPAPKVAVVPNGSGVTFAAGWSF